MSISIVMYHYVRHIKDSAYPHIKGLEFEDFRRQLDWFAESGYRVISTQDMIAMLTNSADSAESQKTRNLPADQCVWFTFDDGYKDHYRYVYPELMRRGYTGSFYIPTRILEGHVLDVNKIHYILACTKDMDALVERTYALLDEARERGYALDSNRRINERLAKANRWDPAEVIFVKRVLQNELPVEIRAELVGQLFTQTVTGDEADFAAELYMTPDEMREMKMAGMHFGLHGHHHIWMNRTPQEAMATDMREGYERMKAEQLLDEATLIMNYPYGGVNECVTEAARKLGCRLGITIEPADVCDTSEPMLLPRWDTNDFYPKKRI